MRLRLCRQMCGRAAPFRLELMKSGLRPNSVRSPGMTRRPIRWSRAATVHQTAQPRTSLLLRDPVVRCAYSVQVIDERFDERLRR
jgi:hypothetical protein